ncbi:MAG TPA: hypothetical protein VEI04_06480 [Syntrophobacteria bacterium]|nr:hypothetical protein [Syntrophobacteria bacterium]
MSAKRYGLLVALGLTAGLLGGGLSSRVLFGQPSVAQQPTKPSRILTAEEFQLVDEKGTVRAALSMSMGGPGIVLFDKAGKFRAVLGLATGEDSPVLSLGDAEGRHRATLALRVNGEPYFALLDKEGKVRMSFTLDRERGPRIALLDNNELTRAALGAVDLTKVTAMGAIEAQQPVSLVLFDRDEKPIWRAP